MSRCSHMTPFVYQLKHPGQMEALMSQQSFMLFGESVLQKNIELPGLHHCGTRPDYSRWPQKEILASGPKDSLLIKHGSSLWFTLY